MTGLYPPQTGIASFTTQQPNKKKGPAYLGRLNEQCVTLGEVLGAADYGCYYVGKWHLHHETGPIRSGFDEFYGYTFDHSHDQWDANYYQRLPEGRPREIDPDPGEFYATDVFNQYALEFIRQGQQREEPWFLFLGHSSPHFPVQAPASNADKYYKTYLRGWDVLRQERFERMQELGLVDNDRWTLTERSLVPVDRDDIANGFSGQQNPTWNRLDEDRRRDLARRMALFAAMVEQVDRGVGDIVSHLKQTGDYENTLILLLSDNGACYEWGPFGFDGRSRLGNTKLHTGDELQAMGGPGTHHSYGSGWANLGNTPFRLYKHFTHEGGVCTPFIAHWPQGIEPMQDWVRQPGHIIDVMPTLRAVAKAEYPTRAHEQAIAPEAGISLLPAFAGNSLPRRPIYFEHQAARGILVHPWKAVWGKRMPWENHWELYDLSRDRCETNNLAEQYPRRLQDMVRQWEAYEQQMGL